MDFASVDGGKTWTARLRLCRQSQDSNMSIVDIAVSREIISDHESVSSGPVEVPDERLLARDRNPPVPPEFGMGLRVQERYHFARGEQCPYVPAAEVQIV